ncbi:hypothetical protein PV325_006077 [Microctonus aethiopoides]|uniref:Uncharacterized protein n=1 Tax=Microctonus aethiopoides TaxID=144406 RepID=A0AA39FBS7_9HYME|nr:hypothetical protein PV325_006077 [Microctonus aethiopoides]KAK0090508.1 hypothetical protein PV326_004113 [Microctonus aethiopoides]KAK0166501.1 hypothetical protein PV328_004916 [Microctonus aethiopoides]
MPSYEFNQFTGRLKNSLHIQPLYPIKPVPLPKTESPKMIWDTIKTKAVKTDVQQTSGYSTISPKVLAKMKHFQADMTKPVFLMGGTPDKILFGVTIALGVICTIETFRFLARNWYKK